MLITPMANPPAYSCHKRSVNQLIARSAIPRSNKPTKMTGRAPRRSASAPTIGAEMMQPPLQASDHPVIWVTLQPNSSDNGLINAPMEYAGTELAHIPITTTTIARQEAANSAPMLDGSRAWGDSSGSRVMRLGDCKVCPLRWLNAFASGARPIATPRRAKRVGPDAGLHLQNLR